MAISKSTPYVRYKKDFTSSLHLGTIHIESEYLDRTQKTTIESIHGMTWHNKVVNENKELNLLSDTQLELTELEKQYWNTGEKRVSVDEIHTLEEVEPNEDGTYTYTVNSMEGEYIEIYDGINNITSTSDGLDGQFEIVYDTTEEDISGNIALDQVAQQYEITDSGVGAITGAKSTGLTLINHITEPSKEEVVAIQEYEGQYFTIENTVQGNIKSAILKGQTLVNLSPFKSLKDVTPSVLSENSVVWYGGITKDYFNPSIFKPNTKYIVKFGMGTPSRFKGMYIGGLNMPSKNGYYSEHNDVFTTPETTPTEGVNVYFKGIDGNVVTKEEYSKIEPMIIEYQDGMENWDIPYFEGIQSVKVPVLTTTGKNLFDFESFKKEENRIVGTKPYSSFKLNLKPNTKYSWNRFSNDGFGSTCYILINTVLGSSSNALNWLIHSDSEKINYSIGTFSTDNTGVVYISGIINNDNQEKTFELLENLIIIESGTSPVSYEPYKSNILTVNEEVELRGIGDVQDELDCLTGEVTQRIGEIVLDGSSDEEYAINGNAADGLTRFVINSISNRKQRGNTISNLLPITNNYNYYGLFSGNSLNIVNNCLTIDDLRIWLQQNPITIQYELATESVKTVDLTVQNQDGGIIPHIQTQQGITHVSTSSDGLTPVVEMSCSYDTIIKPNTTYTIKLDRPNVSDTMYLQVDLGGTMMMLDADVNAFTIKTPSTLSHSQLRLSGTGNTVKEIIVLEGNRVNDKIEYFEGMKNVENPILVVSNCPYVFGKGGRL